MLGLPDPLMKRIAAQMAEFVATQARIARRVWSHWFVPADTLRPVKIAVRRDRSRSHGGDGARRPPSF